MPFQLDSIEGMCETFEYYYEDSLCQKHKLLCKCTYEKGNRIGNHFYNMNYQILHWFEFRNPCDHLI